LVLIESKAVSPALAGWAPADFQARYKLPSSTKGAGQIVAIVDAFDNPDVVGDLATYRSRFGLGPANFAKYNQYGTQGPYPTGSFGWGLEIDLDVEMVSAVCPLCTIYLVEANGADPNDLQLAETRAVKLGAHIISNSWICYADVTCVGSKYFDTPGVEYLAGSGDFGYYELGAPSVFSSVDAIGGTVLSKKGSQYSEHLWDGSGGGCETGMRKPWWQRDEFCAGRSVSDAAAVAWNVAEYDSYGDAGWVTVAGTSIATPMLAAIFALAGNAGEQHGGQTFWQRRHLADLHNVCASKGCLSGQYSFGGGWGSPNGIGAFWRRDLRRRCMSPTATASFNC
jgi:subtilase family serine protease